MITMTQLSLPGFSEKMVIEKNTKNSSPFKIRPYPGATKSADKMLLTKGGYPLLELSFIPDPTCRLMESEYYNWGNHQEKTSDYGASHREALLYLARCHGVRNQKADFSLTGIDEQQNIFPIVVHFLNSQALFLQLKEEYYFYIHGKYLVKAKWQVEKEQGHLKVPLPPQYFNRSKSNRVLIVKTLVDFCQDRMENYHHQSLEQIEVSGITTMICQKELEQNGFQKLSNGGYQRNADSFVKQLSLNPSA